MVLLSFIVKHSDEADVVMEDMEQRWRQTRQNCRTFVAPSSHNDIDIFSFPLTVFNRLNSLFNRHNLDCLYFKKFLEQHQKVSSQYMNIIFL